MLLQRSIRIDMALTDEYIFKLISEALPSGEGEISYERIASMANCHRNTAMISTRRLVGAGRLIMHGGRGRKAVTYKVVNSDKTRLD